MKPPTVLIVDDDRGLARLMEKTVGRLGYSAAVALCGGEALAWLENHRADLMLLDLKLPDMSGEELVDRLDAVGRPVPFIVVSGQGDERVAVKMMRRGARDYLIKDTEFQEMVPLVVRRTLTYLANEKKLAVAEESLQREHAFSDAVLSTSGALMMVVDAEGRVVRFNRACEKLTGYAFHEVEGRLYWEPLLPQPEWLAAAARVKSILADRQPREREGRLLTKDGKQRDVSWSLTALRDNRGGVEYIIASGIDITERKRLERDILDAAGREQRRIGHDLHDGLCQVLAGVDMLAKVLHKRLARNSPGDAEAAAGISRYVRQAVEQARLLARGLAPVELETNGLMSALQELAHGTRTLFKVSCAFECPVPVLMENQSRATHVYRIAQEAVNNAVRHGGAENIVISLRPSEEGAALRVADDGKGFDPAELSGAGMGLRSMKFRAGMIGGTLEVRASAPHGAIVECRFPLTV